MPRPTVKDIAKHAGVSLATIDRVLNGRPGVRQKTIDKVNAAIEALGYVRDVNAANLARKNEYKFAFFIAEDKSRFPAVLAERVRRIEGRNDLDRISIDLIMEPVGNVHEMAARLNGLAVKGYDGLAVLVPEAPLLRDAIKNLVNSGVYVVTLVTDLPDSGRHRFVGSDNIAAGRIAGFLVSRFVGKAGGKVLVTTSSMQLRDSLERRLGFDRVVAETNDKISVLPTIEGHHSKGLLEESVRRAFDLHPDIAAIYSAGPGVSVLMPLLEAMGRKDLVLVAHDMTPRTRAGLESGAIDALIANDPGHLVRSCLRVLRALKDETAIIEPQEHIRTSIVLKESLMDWEAESLF